MVFRSNEEHLRLCSFLDRDISVSCSTRPPCQTRAPFGVRSMCPVWLAVQTLVLSFRLRSYAGCCLSGRLVVFSPVHVPGSLRMVPYLSVCLVYSGYKVCSLWPLFLTCTIYFRVRSERTYSLAQRSRASTSCACSALLCCTFSPFFSSSAHVAMFFRLASVFFLPQAKVVLSLNEWYFFYRSNLFYSHAHRSFARPLPVRDIVFDVS
jgi:hypothetical protein